MIHQIQLLMNFINMNKLKMHSVMISTILDSTFLYDAEAMFYKLFHVKTNQKIKSPLIIVLPGSL